MNPGDRELEPWEIEWPEEDSDEFETAENTADSPRVHEDSDLPRPKLAYDLEERTAKFGEAVILFLKKIHTGPHTNRLIDQLTGCGTSVGANYCEADDAISRKEFALKINTCRKEARESKYFIRMLACAVPEVITDARTLWLEAHALHRIFAKIRRTTLRNE